MTPAVRQVYSQEAMATLEQAHRQIIPAGRMCTLDEVARLVTSLFMKSESVWFNGSTVDFTGGMTLQLLDPLLNSHRYPQASGTRGNSSSG